jgi:chromosome segregation ATPase
MVSAPNLFIIVGLMNSEEVEEAKRKTTTRIKDLQEQREAANARLANLEKQRARMMGELDDAQIEVERALGIAANLEKKERMFDKTCEDWKRKHDDLNAELDATQRETRNLGTEAFKLKNANDEIAEQVRLLICPLILLYSPLNCSSKHFVVRTRICHKKSRTCPIS